MTHDELLAEIDSYAYNYKPKSALRAVVELHKPCDMRCDGGQHIADSNGNVTYIPGEKDCTHCMGCEYDYPCPTIQAIEKELG